MEQKGSPVSAVDVKPKIEKDKEVEPPPQSVIIRRQVITTAGTIEENIEETKIEQIAGEEVVNTSEPQEEQVITEEGTTIVQYEEETAPDQNYDEAQSVYVTEAVITTEGYPSQADYHQQSQTVAYTTSLDMQQSNAITIEPAEYAQLESVNNPHYNGPYENEASQFLHHQYPNQYPGYSDDKAGILNPQTALYRDTDPNLGSSRYQVCLLYYIY